LPYQMLHENVVKWKACVNVLIFWVPWKVGNACQNGPNPAAWS